jgi:hypothetical protein
MNTCLAELIRGSFAGTALLVSAPALAAPAPEAAPTSDQPTADPLDALVVVRVEMDGSEEVARFLHAEIVDALREAQVAWDLPKHAPLEVMVSPDPESPGTYEVVYRQLGETLESWSCLCSGEELRARLAHDAVEVWNARVATLAEDAPTVSSASLAPEPTDTEPAARRRPRGLVPYVAGIATTAVGTAVVVGMTALLVSDAAADRDRNPTTLGLMVGGVATLAIGITLWSVGAHRRNHARLSVLPTIRSRGAMVTLGGRF